MSGPGSNRKEFESLLAALDERELSDWERQRLWELIADVPERAQEYLSTLQLNDALAALDTETIASQGVKAPASNVIRMRPDERERPSSLSRVSSEKSGDLESASTTGASQAARNVKAFSAARLASRLAPPREWARMGIAAAIAATLFAGAVLLGPSSRDGDAVASSPRSVPGDQRTEAPAEEETTPESSYEKSLLAVGEATGSLNRPPTTFASAAAAAALSKEALPERISFNQHIRPVLSENCFACHGPDASGRKGNLRLDVAEGAFENDAIVAGDASASEVMARILTDEVDDLMPPLDSHKALDPYEKELIAAWIDQGADWEAHWSFERPLRAELPAEEGVEAWARNPIDHFVYAELERHGLEPNPEATPYQLARRTALDLTGLPPEPAALDALMGNFSDEVYRDHVASLASSPAAAEHRTRFWLDAARYGDTHGMHLDNYREIWPYRDWVIQAFRSNLPFDRFVIEQLAGDLLPNPTRAQQIATGFNRCNVTTAEGGSIPAELDVRYMVDRVDTTSTVFLGMTASCASCHDHKYDPLSMREFYALGAFFNNTTQPAMDGNQRDTPPVIVLPDKAYAADWDALQERRHSYRERMRQRREKEAGRVEAWWQDQERREVPTHPVDDESLALWLPFSKGEPGSGAATDELGKGERWESSHPGGKRGVRFDQGSSLEPIEDWRVDPTEPLTLSFWIRTPDKVLSATLFECTTTVPVGGEKADKGVDEGEVGEDEVTEPTVARTPETPAEPAAKAKAAEPRTRTVGWTVKSSVQGAITLDFTDRAGKKISGRLPSDAALAPRSWQHVCIRYAGGQSDSSVTILVNGESRMLRKASDNYFDEAAEAFDAKLRVASKFPTGGLSDVRIYRRWLNDDEVSLLASEFELQTLLASDVDWQELEPNQRELAAHHFWESHDRVYTLSSRRLANTQARQDYIYSRSPTSLVMAEHENREPHAWVLERGEYDKRLERVTPDVPAALPPLRPGDPRNRLGLAHWLVQPEHPLTARVTVNRLWQSVFGTGLVRTSEDFGIMGEQPSHPELLDWLAVEFIESGWDVRHMLELMVDSATYRQSATIDSRKRELDPENRLLSRGPRVRLDAEVLRDQALAVSGLLRPDIGGPSVKPYQPSGLWKAVAFTGSNTRTFAQDQGDALYRRSLYTFWKRTSPPPSMAAFNAPTREHCTVRRERTNTPLQALVLLNDKQFVEAARHLATLGLRETKDDEGRARWMIQRALSRPATAEDVQDILEMSKQFREHYDEDLEAARDLIDVGDSPAPKGLEPAELAAWTLVANTLMNRDDFINES